MSFIILSHVLSVFIQLYCQHGCWIHTTKFKIPLITRNFTTAMILVSVISFMNHFDRTVPVGQPTKANSTVTAQATIRDDDKTSARKSFPSFYLLIITNKPRTYRIFIFNPNSFLQHGRNVIGHKAASSELFRVPIAVTTALQVWHNGTQKEVGALTSYRSSQE